MCGHHGIEDRRSGDAVQGEADGLRDHQQFRRPAIRRASSVDLLVVVAPFLCASAHRAREVNDYGLSGLHGSHIQSCLSRTLQPYSLLDGVFEPDERVVPVAAV